MKKGAILLMVIILTLVLSLPLTAVVNSVPGQKEGQESIRRFALVIGANDGGPRRVKLRYAVSDAKSVLKVLEELGGVYPDDSRLLLQPTRESLLWELERMKDRIARAKEQSRRVEAVFYYSGHSDERNILMGKEKVSYQEFRDRINEMAADVRIAVLDSCASGAFTRLKGGKKRPPFLVDTAYDMKGYAVMTSSSSNEASQESERLSGSFFTHFLVSGLRGAADMSQDGRVTLSEAYQFAFNETLEQTEKTVSGPQHPNYNIGMTGTGDVIITDIRQSDAVLRLGKDISGKVYIHNHDNVLVVELNKAPGRAIELGLDEGKYRIINIVNGCIFETSIKLPKGKSVEVTGEAFRKMDKIDTVARGDLKIKIQRQQTLKRRYKTVFFLEWNSKLTRVYGDWMTLIGFKFGLTFNRQFSLGYLSLSNADNGSSGLPSYRGITADYHFPSRSMFNLRAGLLVGKGEEYYFNEDIWTTLHYRFIMIEPELGVTLNLSGTFKLYAGVGLRFKTRNHANMSIFSASVGIKWGR